jgi:NADPH:quinone reductase-like Zn-dependent oxidoreductase
MKAMRLRSPAGLENLYLSTEQEPRKPGFGEIVVRLHATSLNFHDWAVVSGMLNPPDGIVPMTDGAGVVVEVGENVTQHKVGDHVVSAYFPAWESGVLTPEAERVRPGDQIDGYAREYARVPAHYFLTAPRGFTHAEAATLTCAGTTAWRALSVKSRIKAGDSVLVQGTGGVSIFALQIARIFGAEVIATSSSDEKNARQKALGAHHVINYKTTPEWGRVVREITGGRGVDHVVEIGGSGTFGQSIEACAIDGDITMIGVLAGRQGDVLTGELTRKRLRVEGILVGSRHHLRDFIRAIDINGMKPVIDRSFALENLADAFRHQISNAHVGKICVEF